MTQRVLIVDDEENLRQVLSVVLQRDGYQTEEAKNGQEALEKLKSHPYDIVLCDIKMPGMDGMELLDRLKGDPTRFPTIIMMSAYATHEDAIEAMKMGAYDYISKPFKPDEVLLALRKAKERERLRKENLWLRREVEKEYSFENIVSTSQCMLEIFSLIKKVAEYKSTVLITGESGTGKELVAKAIHYNSDRASGPFVPINCGAIPDNLLESELFGHVKGSFTDATRSRKGLLEEAHGGTVLLDEIGELPKFLQVKILRFLQESEIRRIGDTKTLKVDVRVIAATARDLAKEVERGTFREDLYYRLNVISVHLPPLRERKMDIPALVRHFIAKYNEKLGTSVEEISKEALRALMAYNWPGNVRELENAIERAMVLSAGPRIEIDHLPEAVLGARDSGGVPLPLDTNELSIKKATQAIEKDLIVKALQKTNRNRTHAARLLEISHRTLLYKIEEYGINL